jgi:hypothetical protein
MIGPETMRQESNPRLAAWSVARLLHPELGRMSWVLGGSGQTSQEWQKSRERKSR